MSLCQDIANLARLSSWFVVPSTVTSATQVHVLDRDFEEDYKIKVNIWRLRDDRKIHIVPNNTDYFKGQLNFQGLKVKICSFLDQKTVWEMKNN